MTERYTRVFTTEPNLYQTGSPIVISAAALLKDNKDGRVLAQLKYRNISEYGSVITALIVALQPLDVSGNLLGEEIEYQYLDLSVAANEEFGQKTPIYLPDSTTRGLQVRVVRTIFENGNILSSEEQGKEYFQPLPAQHSISEFIKDDKSRDQYIYEHGNSCKYAPLEYKDLWICCCGGINKINIETCVLCKSTKESVLDVDEVSLTELFDERKAREKAIRQQQVEEEERNRKQQLEEEERLRREKEVKHEKKRKKIKKVLRIAALLLVLSSVATSAVVLLFCYILPMEKYEEADKLYSQNKYEEAAQLFDSLDFKDSKERAKEAINRNREIIREEQLRKKIEKEYKENFCNAKKEYKKGDFFKALSYIEKINGEEYSKYREKTDLFLIKIAKKSLINCNSAIYENSKKMIVDSNIINKDDVFLRLENEYKMFKKIDFIKSTKRIKKANRILKKLKNSKIKGVKYLKKVIRRYKGYIGKYVRTNSHGKKEYAYVTITKKPRSLYKYCARITAWYLGDDLDCGLCTSTVFLPYPKKQKKDWQVQDWYYYARIINKKKIEFRDVDEDIEKKMIFYRK